MPDKEQHPFQDWLDKKGAVGVNFVLNETAKDVDITDILDGAMLGVDAYERGDYKPYADPAFSCAFLISFGKPHEDHGYQGVFESDSYENAITEFTEKYPLYIFRDIEQVHKL